MKNKENGAGEEEEERKKKDWRDTTAGRREEKKKLVRRVEGQQGKNYGKKEKGSVEQVTNGMKFSYPGYNEMSTGYPNDAIDKNEFGPNPNATVFEWLNKIDEFRGKVAIYGTWDV